ncbi:RNA polymerase sigma factor SigJ [Granulicoccus phenolivorans]|uniref:RNA polymerase sigma factor SigJ n=1 Tax=Granulicoccus phenolivorans TaxID=266854 RepID=UPI0004184940|nr:RNA polymerase sigma factor SigJ [Granulicoccus phenolivorans]
MTDPDQPADLPGPDELTGPDDLTGAAAERRSLLGLTYRMLGTMSDAEDAVQETYTRWYRLTAEQRSEIENPEAWLTRVAGRVCLDHLTSARARRERYIGEWLPEPIPGDALPGPQPPMDPQDRVSLDDSVSTALLVVLEQLTPAERVAYVLHEVFAVPYAEIAETVGRTPEAVRQLSSQARRHIHDRRPRPATRAEHDAVFRSFVTATRTGDLTAMLALLDPAVVAHSDGGGVVSAARNPVVGPDRVARLLLGLLQKRTTATLLPTVTGDGLSVLVAQDGAADSIVSVSVSAGLVTDVYLIRNPAKLTQW